ncbi:MAG: hypothetical protein K2I40_00370, partial [Bifidobacterium castoris]|nr:hypothetical protein [Bifidobacterium castoris]
SWGGRRKPRWPSIRPIALLAHPDSVYGIASACLQGSSGSLGSAAPATAMQSIGGTSTIRGCSAGR